MPAVAVALVRAVALSFLDDVLVWGLRLGAAALLLLLLLAFLSALRAARPRRHTSRRGCYRPCLDALESALGHFEDPALLEQAHELLPTLPPLIRLEIA